MARVQSVLLPERISALLISEAVLSFTCFAVACLWRQDINAFFGRENGTFRILLVVATVLFGCYLNGLYGDLRWRSRITLILHLCNVFGIALVAQGILEYLQLDVALPRDSMVIGCVLNFAALLMWRIMYGSLLARVFATQRVLFLGHDAAVAEIAGRMSAKPELGCAVAGFLSDDRLPGEMIEHGTVLGRIEDAGAIIRQIRPHRLIVGTGEMRSKLPLFELIRAKRAGITVEAAGTVYEEICGRVCSASFRPSQIIYANELAARPGSLALQSIYTNLLGLVFLIFAGPLMILIAIAIRLTSRGGAMIRETYAGHNGIPFTTNRFRCAVLGSPESVTRAGRTIRALHLEYLPRVMNLVRGEMALVGPAPERMEFSEALSEKIPFYRQRQAVKPGLTGWTQIQISSREPLDALRAIECDLYYTKHISLALDAYILLHTIRGILPFLD